MADRNLIRGAQTLGLSKISGANQAFQTSLQNSMAEYYKIAAVRKAEKKAIDAQTAAYINTLNTEMDVSQLNANQSMAVKNYLLTERNKYAQAANRASKLGASHPEYANAVNEINSIQSSFANLASELKAYKEDKINYVKDFNQGLISDGNTLGTLSEASNIYTDGGSLGIGAGGALSFYNDDLGKYETYRQIQKPFLKDFKGADQIMQINKQAYNSGSVLQGARQNMVRNDIKQIVNKGGRDSLLSLATDDFMIEGGLNIQDESLFEIENEDLLKDYVVDAYVNAITESSIEGANSKRPAVGTRRTSRASGSTKDEINAGAPKAEKALNFSSATIGDSNAVVEAANSMGSTKNVVYMTQPQFYNLFLEGEGLKDNSSAREAFSNTYGDSSIFMYNKSNPSYSKGVEIDINNQEALYNFYIESSDLSTKTRNYYINQYPGNKASGGGALDNL